MQKNNMARPYTNAERRVLRQCREGFAALPRLQDCRAEVHKPCEVCGCVLFAPVSGGYRCLWCMPPLDLPTRLRDLVERTPRFQ